MHAHQYAADAVTDADFAWVESQDFERDIANKGGRKCAKRVKAAGCYLSNNDFNRIDTNVEKCKHMESGSGKTELETFLMSDADKVVVVKTKGKGVVGSACPVMKYTMDQSGIVEMKVVGNRLFMLSKDGQVYFMHGDECVYELLNSNKKSYSTVNDIKGSSDGNSVTLIGSSFEAELTTKDLADRYTTDRSLFRDG
ncbi:MAG: hypothetical protein A2X94_15145 [Bdellovibrionales bacterium GWB1_55_8]|nr:MAG: hypothetical protein A2X94_15145 [Bdellovibrionales bacterium GWB1_55_8]